MLRQVVTKALETKRAEIEELARRGESEDLPSKTLPDSIQTSPQKLTFYDVVQPARQQASLEKTKRSSGDLIGLLDLSDTSQPVANSAIMIGVPCDHALLDSSDPMAVQQIYPPLSSQTESEISTVNHNLEVRSNLQIIAELDATSCQQPSVADLLGLVELPAFQTLGSHETERSKLSSLAEAS